MSTTIDPSMLAGDCAEAAAGTAPDPDTGDAGEQALSTTEARSRRSTTLWLIGISCIIGGAVLTAWAAGLGALVEHPITLWALVPLFLLAEAVRVDVAVGRQNHSITATEVGVAVALLVGEPLHYMLAVTIAAVLLYGAYYRLRPLKLVFNIGLAMAQAGITLAIFIALREASPDALMTNLGVLLACMAGAALSDLAVTTAIRLSGEKVSIVDTGIALVSGGLCALVPAAVGLEVVALGRRSTAWLVIAAIPLVLAWLSYRAFVRQRRENRRNEFLYRASLALHGSEDLDTAVADLLEQVRSGLRAESASLVIWRDGMVVTAMAHVDEVKRAVLHTADGRLASRSAELFVTSDRDDTGGARLVSETGPGGAPQSTIVAPVRAEEVTGLLIVGNRLAKRDVYDGDDLDLTTVVAAQVAVALDHEHVAKTLQRLQDLEERLVHQANHDTLTGLASRRLFNETLAATDGADTTSAVVLIDLDDFKRLNDTIGHVMADQVLMMIGERLQGVVRRKDVVARIGGDEFAVILDEVQDDRELLVACERIRVAFSSPFEVPGYSLAVNCTVGATRVGDGFADYTALHRADVALYQAKTNGKNRVLVYEPWMSTAGELRTALVREAVAGFERDQFVLLYQPLYDLDSREVVGAEALVRWNHPERGLLTPGDFLEILEEAGFADRLGTRVLTEAIAELARLNEATGRHDLVMHINLSARQLRNPRLVSLIEGLLRRHDVAPEQLVIELTESSMIENLDSASGVFTELYELGARIALDDFGTGYSSLTYLHMFPISIVKIDRAFVTSIARSNRDRLLVGAIVSLARSLGLEVVAEGIEREDQRATLQRLGCTRGQGYLFSRPIEPAALFIECGASARRGTRAPRRSEQLALPSAGITTATP